MRASIALGLLGAVFVGIVKAGDVEVVETEFRASGSDSWYVSTTLRHADEGWDHYADAWRVVDADGNELGRRVLHHPHVNEQPFTRSLGGVAIPSGTTVVYVEARDKVHGWSGDRIRVDLTQSSGDGFRVER